jgi:Cu/Ag efflux protein CusF
MLLTQSQRTKSASLLCVAWLVMVVGCKQQPTPQPITMKHYPVSGVVMAKNVSSKKITLQHGDVPGFMDAMTMDYSLPDAAVLEKLQPGDHISGQIVVDPADASKYWLEDVLITAEPARGKATAGPPHAPPVGERVRTL